MMGIENLSILNSELEGLDRDKLLGSLSGILIWI